MIYFKQEVRKGAAVGSMAAGFLGFILFQFITPAIPKEIAAMLLSLIGYGVGNFTEIFWHKVAVLRRYRALIRVG